MSGVHRVSLMYNVVGHCLLPQADSMPAHAESTVGTGGVFDRHWLIGVQSCRQDRQSPGNMQAVVTGTFSATVAWLHATSSVKA